MNPESPAESARALLDAADVLRTEAALLRRLMHERGDAADPVPEVAEMQQLAEVFEKAAASPPGTRAQVLVGEVSHEDVGILRRLIESLGGPGLGIDSWERAIRADSGMKLELAAGLVRSARTPLSRADG